MRRVSVAHGVAWVLIGAAVVSVSPPVRAVASGPKAAGNPEFEHVHALAVAADGRTLWLGAHTGLFRSGDGGRAWQPVKLSGVSSHLDIMTLLADPRDGRTLFAGGKWVRVDDGPPGEVKVLTSANIAASDEGMIYLSTDGGETWTERR